MQRGFDKRGVSAVVATVLIILITIAAISILWATIIPIVKESLGADDVCNKVDVSIVTSQGYTCYVPSNITLVQVSKGGSDVNITGLKFFITSSGNSVEYIEQKVAYSTISYDVYYLNTSEFSTIEKLSVVPIIKTGAAEKSCSIISVENIPICSGVVNIVESSVGKLLNRVSVGSGLSGGGNGGETPSQDTVYPIFSNYNDNNFTLTASGFGIFNVSIANINGTVLFEINNQNYSANLVSGTTYNYSLLLNNGTYSYKWYSWGNGTNKNYNVSLIRDYVVKTCVPDCSCAENILTGETCDNLCGGSCQGDGSVGSSCGVGSDCDYGICISSLCVQCDDNSDCINDGGYCNTRDHVCTSGIDPAGCGSESDCMYRCEDSEWAGSAYQKCTSGVPISSCLNAGDCALGYVCSGGWCERDNSCINNWDCPNSCYICRYNQCVNVNC